MKTIIKQLAGLAIALPLAALAQTPPTPSTTDKSSAMPPPGMESTKTTETGQTTTYPKSDGNSGKKKAGAVTDKEKNKITRGDTTSSTSQMAPLVPETAEKPAKEGAQSGPTK